jgi:ribonuclease G
MRKLMATDKAKHTILPLTKFGLMQITRQRVRPVAVGDVTDVCPTCNGTGRIEPTVLLDRKIENQVQFLSKDRGVKYLRLRVSPYVASYLCQGFLSLRRRWMWKYKVKIKVVADQSLGMVDVKYLGAKGELLIV